MAVIDIGAEAIDRSDAIGNNRTAVNIYNPANDTGFITSVELYMDSAGGVDVATFSASGNHLTTRDCKALGYVESGSKQTFSGLDMAVAIGDYLGGYFGSSIYVERSDTGAGYWLLVGKYIPCTSQLFGVFTPRTISLHGIGVTIEAPTVTTQAVSSIEATTATGNGNITATGGENCTKRGVCWNTGGNPTVANDKSEETDSFGAGAFTRPMTGLTPGQHYYVKAYAYNSAGYGYGAQVEFDTPPAIPDPPTNVAATSGVHTDKVIVTWTKSDGATDYQVKRDGTPLGWLGDVATYDDTGAGAPTVTPGDADASDGEFTDKVALSLSGQSANNGATHTYVVEARTNGGESSGDSDSDTGYRGVGELTYQWQRSAADSDANYSNINGATTEAYDDTDAPADGTGRYYRCVVSAEGA